jgi:alkyl sulfatase BDS1-like metallo-beta-lactamase superfamily hydrolase
MESIFASHHWPTWGNAKCLKYLAAQRDAYRYLHDQTLRLANQGWKPNEIAAVMKFPSSLDKVWSTRPYYGSLHHNARAQYNLRLGFFDGNPAELHPLPNMELGAKYVEAIGGASKVIRLGQQAYDKGEYRWCGHLVNNLVYSDPSNKAARDLLANCYDQMGYQSESGPWRNFYLTGADELRRGVMVMPTPNSANADTIRAMPLDLFLDFMGVRLNAEKAKDMTMVLEMTDVKEVYEVGVEHGCLHYSKIGTGRRRPANPDVTLITTRTAFDSVMLKEKTFKDLVKDGKAKFKGDQGKFVEFASWLDDFEFWFDIVTSASTGKDTYKGDGSSSASSSVVSDYFGEWKSSRLAQIQTAIIVGLAGLLFAR